MILLATSVTSVVQAEVRTFRNPAFEGYRLDYCKNAGRACGERVATEWCVTQGYEFASDWGIERDIGVFQPTISLDSRAICDNGNCDGFLEITCGRETQSFSVPSLGGETRGTVFTPDRRHAAVAVTREEIQHVVPGCSQFEPGELLCQSAPEYQHCRTLMQDGYVLGCRAILALDGITADLREAGTGDYHLSLKARASITVEKGNRGEGRVRGETQYTVAFALPKSPEGTPYCLQRHGYEYHQTGPDGGSSEISTAEECDEPLKGRFEPHDDDILYAYNLCEGRRAWGSSLEATTDLVVAAIFHFAATSSSTSAEVDGSNSVAPYVAIAAPVEVICSD